MCKENFLILCLSLALLLTDASQTQTDKMSSNLSDQPQPSDEVPQKSTQAELDILKQINFMAYIYIYRSDSTVHCSGTLISNTSILTAASCLEGAISAKILLGMGIDKISEKKDTIKELESSSFIVHEKFNSVTLKNNIALIRLEQPVELNDRINVVSLPENRYTKDCNTELAALVLGWVICHFRECYQNDILLEKNVYITNKEDCRSPLHNLYYPSNIYSQGTSCGSGIGSPLMFEGSQIGIVSTTNDRCYIYEDTFYHRNWIQYKTRLDSTDYKIPKERPEPIPLTPESVVKSPKQYPFMAFLIIQKPSKIIYCGGTLILDRYILTAASCLENAQRIEVVLGVKDILKKEDNGVHLVSTHFIIHEEYDVDTTRNNIGLIRLDQPVQINEHIRTIPLPKKSSKNITTPTRPARLTSWKACDWIDSVNNVVSETKLTIVGCKCDLPKPFEESHMCTEYEPCASDNGDPLISQGVQIGIKVGFGLYTDTFYYLKWIKDNTEADYERHTFTKSQSENFQKRYPFMALLHIERNDATSMACGGTLIADRYILTTAACLNGATGVSVTLGTTNVFNDESTAVYLKSKDFIIHEKFNIKSRKNNIGLIHLDSPVTKSEYINIISLNTTCHRRIIDTKIPVTALGWETSNENSVFNGLLSQMKTNIVDSEKCLLMSSELLVRSHFFTENGFYSNMGAPLIAENSQIGIFLGRTSSCDVYEDTRFHSEWIQYQIGSDSADSKISTSYTEWESESKNPLEPTFMVFMYIQPGNRNCVGTLIDDLHVLTAAHCLQSATDVSMIIGNKNISSLEVQKSELFIIHEDYNNKTLKNDIALVRLLTSIPKDVPLEKVSLATILEIETNTKLAGASATVLSWQRCYLHSINELLMEKEVKVLDFGQCASDSKNQYQESKIYTEDGPCCKADSGAPLIFNDIQIGIVSGGISCCTMYENVAYHRTWIQKKIAQSS